jgi:tRNA G18 (ribose-2'-O)-methylase SpoU
MRPPNIDVAIAHFSLASDHLPCVEQKENMVNEGGNDVTSAKADRKHIVEETVSMNPAFDFDGLDEEVAQALVDLSHYGERSREHLTRYARQRANQFVWLRASNAQYAKQHSNLLTADVD